MQLDPNKPIWQNATVIQQPTNRSPRRYQVQTESGARYFRNRRHLRPAIQSEPPEDLMGQPATPAELGRVHTSHFCLAECNSNKR